MNPFQRGGHKIKPNHSNAVPRYIFALDTETKRHATDKRGKKFSHTLRLAVGISGRFANGCVTNKRFYRFRTESEIWDKIHSLTRANYTLWIVAHNALFDMVVAGMPEQFEQGKLVPDQPRAKRNKDNSKCPNEPSSVILSIESPPTIIACRSGLTQGRIIIVDSMNWFPCKLADLGSALLMEKYDMPPFEATDDEWFHYCWRDTDIVFQSFIDLMKWVSDNDMGMFRYTGPAQAMAAYRHRFMPVPIYVHDNLPVKAIERSAYFGGRFECYRLGEINETVYQFDVNSLFPSVMRHNKFPVALDRFTLSTEYTANLPGIDWKACVAEVELETCDPIYPKRDTRGVAYPVGRFRTTLCGTELNQAYRNGFIKRVRAYAEYRLAPIFEKWVETLWGMRVAYKAEGNKLYDLFTKSLLNSLYGKFAQRSPAWQTVPDKMSALPWSQWVEYNSATGERQEFRSFGWTIQRRDDRELRHDADCIVTDWEEHSEAVTQGEIPNTFIAISAFVAAAARVRMNHIRGICGRKNVYYQGVDSLILTTEGRDRLQASGMISEMELGLLRLQLTSNNGEILGCSDYRLGDKVVIAGKSKSPQFSPQQSGQQLHLSAKSNLFLGMPSNSVAESMIPWKRAGEYWKGTAQPDGWVTPLVLGVATPLGESFARSDATAIADMAEVIRE